MFSKAKTARKSLRPLLRLSRILAEREGFEPSVRLTAHLISSQGRYNHFDISPFCSDHCPNRNSIPHFSSDCKTFFEKSPAIRRIFCFLRRQVSPQTAPCASSARILPMNTPIAEAIISPLVHPLESPRQCSPLTFVFSRSSIFTRLL